MSSQRYPLIPNQQRCYPWQLRFSKNLHFSFASVLVYKHKGIYWFMLFLVRRLSHALPAVVFCYGPLPSPLCIRCCASECACCSWVHLLAHSQTCGSQRAPLPCSFPLAIMTHVISFWNVHGVGCLAKKLQEDVISLVWVKREELKTFSLLNILEW